jgi:hypothetical protein
MSASEADTGLKRKYSHKTLKVLFGLSGNKCGKPGCAQTVIKNATDYSDVLVVAQIAHIYALNKAGPRGKDGLTEAELNAPANLILLCPTDHVVVDGQHETYPADLLFKWKAAQEQAATGPLSHSISDIGFAELDQAARALTNTVASVAVGGLVTLAPADKIAKNGLGPSSAMLLSMGSAKSQEVEQILINGAQLNPDFPQRLSLGFVTHYKKCKAEGLVGDDLFFAMYDWASGGAQDPARQAAGLCILTHLFILCDVFEK